MVENSQESREALREALALLEHALMLLDRHSRSTAPASLDLAIHRLREEIEASAGVPLSSSARRRPDRV